MRVEGAKIYVNIIRRTYLDFVVETYAESFIRELSNKGAEVIPILNRSKPPNCDLFIDLDCGRNDQGNLNFVLNKDDKKLPVLSAIWLIDSHGWPTEHRRSAKKYDHVFFCVWDKRDLFANHKSSHWLPNATDPKWFNPIFRFDYPSVDFGFIGSKNGLDRAKPLIEICEKNYWSYMVKEVKKQNKHRWPNTAKEMSKARFLFNHGQKHDSPNLRVMESMALSIPLISDNDPRSGMNKLFEPWKHYIPYDYDYSNLEEAMTWCINHEQEAYDIADKAYLEVSTKHTIGNRVDTMLEICFGKR